MSLKSTLTTIWVTLIILVSSAPPLSTASPAGVVYVIEIKQEIDRAVASFVERNLRAAEAASASAVILDINTLGGELGATVELRDRLLDSKVRTIAFINQRAISAGALISLATETIFMAPGATIGAATPVTFLGEKAPEKIISYWRAEMRATAERRNRPVELADAMVDESIEIPGIVKKGELLTLTTQEALTHGIADDTAKDTSAVVAKAGLSGTGVVVFTRQPKDFFSLWFTPSVIWFMLGLVLFVVELSAPGVVVVFFGVGAWVTSVTCLVLDISLNTQLAIFLVSSTILLVFLRTHVKSVFMGYAIPRYRAMEELREYVGQKAVVTDPITPQKTGKVEFHGTAWEAEAPETLAVGDPVEITGRDNLTFRVKSLNQGEQ